MNIKDARKFGKEWANDVNKEDIKKLLKGKRVSEKITFSIYKLNSEIAKISKFLSRLKEREEALFSEMINAKMRGDETRAKIYANEIAEIRKIIRTLDSSKLSLEKAMLRLETIFQMGNAAKTLAQIEPVISSVKESMRKIMPELSFELDDVHTVITSLTMDLSTQTFEVSSNSIHTSSEAQKILEEAKIVAEQKIKEKFPHPGKPDEKIVK